MTASKVVAYTDGSALGNPGSGGYGVILSVRMRNGAEHTRELSAGYERTTNNRMELMGVIAALEALTRPCEVELHCDSQYVVRAFQDKWIDAWRARGWKTSAKKPVKNRDLWQRLLAACAPHRVHFVWVRGHAGDPLNERADELARSAASGAKLLCDEGFSSFA